LPDFSQHCEAACIKLWGEPQLRTAKQLRWSGDDAYGSRTYNTSKRVWYDRGAQRGGSTLELIAYSKGLPDEKLEGRKFFDMWRALHELGVGIDPPPPARKINSGGKWPPIRATYPYHDENNVLRFEVVRFDTDDRNMRFRPRRPDGKGGWLGNLEGVRLVLYRLPQLIEAVKAGVPVLLTEGEKDTNTAVERGYAATTMPGGVGKWRAEYDEFLRGADVVIVSDNDPPGQAHAAELGKRLSKIATRVRTIIFEVKDLTAWVEAGGTREQLDALIEQAPDYAPQTEQEAQEAPPQEAEATDADAEIERLAKLTLLAYDQQRKAAADKLDVRALILDRLVRDERERLGLDADDGKQGRAIAFPEPELWPDKVDGVELLNGIAAAIRRHVVMPKAAYHTTALWTLHAYLIDRFLVSPRLGVCSPTKQCGKTTLFDVLARLTPRSLSTQNVTPAVVFRVIEAHRPTLYIDEGDTFLYDNDELRGVLNGNRKGSTVLRTVGDDHEPRAFAVYSACAIALIGSLPDTLHDRAVTVDLQRRRPRERIKPFRPDRADYLDVLARKAARWTQDNATAIGDADPKMPDGIINRAADNWRPLLAIADAAKGKWPKRARKAAEASRGAEGDEGSRLELLLGDIRVISRGKIEMPSAELVAALVAIEGRPWAEMGKASKPLTQNKLARMLKPLKPKITTEDIWIGSTTGKALKGYVFKHFEEAFARYLPQEGASEPRGREEADEMGTSDLFQTARLESDLADGKCEKSANDGHPRGLADGKGDIGGVRLSNGARRQLADLARALAEEQRQGGAEVDMGKIAAFVRGRIQAAGVAPDQVELEVAAITDMLLQ
jgi:hypothetical protein